MVDALAELALRANIPYFYNLPDGIQNGLKYLVAGYDSTTSYDSSYASVGYVDDYVESAYTFMRWFAKNYADQIDTVDTDTGEVGDRQESPSNEDQKEVVKALVKSLVYSNANSSTGSNALTSFLNKLGVSNYTSLKSTYSNAKSGYSDQDFLEEVCNVRRNNSDTGAITGSDANGSIIKTNSSIIPENSTYKTLTDAEYKSFTKNGLTVNITYDNSSSVGSEYNYSEDTYKTKQKLVVEMVDTGGSNTHQ